MTRQVGFIPTQSLYQIEDLIHEKLDGKIFRVTASHTWQKTSRIKQLNEYLALRVSPRHYQLSLYYDRTRMKPLSLSKLISACEKLGAYDMFISQITFILPYEREVVLGPTLAHFVNVPPTPAAPGDEDNPNNPYNLVMAHRKRWLKRHGHALEERRAPRMLVCASAQTVGGSDLHPSMTSSGRFLQWLSKELSGLVLGTEEIETRRLGFQHRGVQFLDGLWSKEVNGANG